MWLLMAAVLICRAAEGVQVIGGDRTAVQGKEVFLSCRLTDIKQEGLTQISWQKKTRETPHNVNFYVIPHEDPPYSVNGYGDRFRFIGNVKENDGSLQLSNVTLSDEGVYTCIFALFPSGNHETEISLSVLVPPITSLKDDHPLLGDEEDTLATCTAAGAKPAAEVTWHTTTLPETVKATTNSTQHANDTTTTVSTLVGVPNREVNHHLVQCVVNHAALPKEETLPFTLQVHFSPTSVNINETSKNMFECKSDANPNASFRWSRADQLWPQSAIREEGRHLQFLSLTSDLNGLYLCEASNQYGQKHSYLYVHVTSGTCTSCWIFNVVVILIAVGTGFAIWHREKIPRYLRKEQGIQDTRHHRVPTEQSPGAHQIEQEDMEEQL